MAIARVLANEDSKIEAVEQKLEKYRQIKQGMMTVAPDRKNQTCVKECEA